MRLTAIPFSMGRVSCLSGHPGSTQLASSSSMFSTSSPHRSLPNRHVLHIHNAASETARPARFSCNTHRQSRRQSTRPLAIPATAAASTQAPTLPLAPPSLQLEFGVGSAQGLREGMEDQLIAFHDPVNSRFYAGVFDGHCGPHAAEWLKDELHQVLSRFLPGGGLYLPDGAVAKAGVTAGSATVDGTGVFGAALTGAFLEADRAVIAHLATQGEVIAVEGSTATALFITPGVSIVVAHVGDSQAVLCRNGQAMLLAMPHRVTGTSASAKAEIERIKACGGWIDDGRVCGFLAVSRALGDVEYKGDGLPSLMQKGVDYGFWDDEFAGKQSFTADPVSAYPAVSETPLTAADEFLILASDGLWDVMEPGDAMRWARNALKAKKTVTEVAEGLVDLALKRHSADNVAVVVIDLAGQAYWNPPKGLPRDGKPGLFAQFFGK